MREEQDINSNKEHTAHTRINDVSKPMKHKCFMIMIYIFLFWQCPRNMILIWAKISI